MSLLLWSSSFQAYSVLHFMCTFMLHAEQKYLNVFPQCAIMKFVSKNKNQQTTIHFRIVAVASVCLSARGCRMLTPQNGRKQEVAAGLRGGGSGVDVRVWRCLPRSNE